MACGGPHLQSARSFAQPIRNRLGSGHASEGSAARGWRVGSIGES